MVYSVPDLLFRIVVSMGVPVKGILNSAHLLMRFSAGHLVVCISCCVSQSHPVCKIWLHNITSHDANRTGLILVNARWSETARA